MARRTFFWCAALVLVAGAAWSASDKAKPGAPAVEPEAARGLDAAIHANLRHVINRGVELYNGGDVAACYRLFEGSLRTLKPLLAHRPALVKQIDDALAGVEKDPVVWQRAFTLRKVLDEIRKDLKPDDSGKPPVEKPPVVKPPVKEPPFDPLPPPTTLKAPRPLEDAPKKPEAKPDARTLLKMPRLLEP